MRGAYRRLSTSSSRTSAGLRASVCTRLFMERQGWAYVPDDELP